MKIGLSLIAVLIPLICQVLRVRVFSFRLFDHAGPDADYSNNANGYLLIKCPTGYKINVSGNVATESTSYDWLNIYDGATTNSTRLINAGGTMSVDVTTTGNNALLWFRSDSSNTGKGIDVTVTIKQ